MFEGLSKGVEGRHISMERAPLFVSTSDGDTRDGGTAGSTFLAILGLGTVTNLGQRPHPHPVP